MNDKIKAHVTEFANAKGYPVDEDSLVDIIRESKRVWRGDESDRRWWTDCFTVVNVNGMLIGFDDATTTGDDSPYDKGWEFDPSTICEVESKEITTTIYQRVD